MAAPLAFQGTFADFKLIKTRSVVQVVIEMPIEHGPAVIAAFGLPSPGAEIPVAVARMTAPETIEHDEPKPARRFGEMPRAQQAGIRCGEAAFWRFLSETTGQRVGCANEAAEAVRRVCCVSSRAELDGPGAADWDDLSSQFSMWMRHPEIAA
jgi:hypothetical protein